MVVAVVVAVVVVVVVRASVRCAVLGGASFVTKNSTCTIIIIRYDRSYFGTAGCMASKR